MAFWRTLAGPELTRMTRRGRPTRASPSLRSATARGKSSCCQASPGWANRAPGCRYQLSSAHIHYRYSYSEVRTARSAKHQQHSEGVLLRLQVNMMQAAFRLVALFSALGVICSCLKKAVVWPNREGHMAGNRITRRNVLCTGAVGAAMSALPLVSVHGQTSGGRL